MGGEPIPVSKRLILILTLSILGFALSLLVWFRAPTYFFWLVAVVVTEFSWIPLLLNLVVLGLAVEKGKFLALVFCLVSCPSFLSPYLVALFRSRAIRRGLERSFPGGAVRGMLHRPFSLLKLCSGVASFRVPVTTMSYGQGSGGPFLLDFYPAADPGIRPLVVVVHGGSWMTGDRGQLPELNHYLARSGYHVAAINYRLAPAYQYPAAVLDSQMAVAFLQEQGEKLRIDREKVILLGRSAGGQIALMAAYDRKPIRGVLGVIAFYAPSDMVWGAISRSNKWVLDTASIFLNYLGAAWIDAPERYLEASPCARVHRGCPPTLILHGRIDSLVSRKHSIRLGEKLKGLQIPYYFLSLPCSTHGFDYSLRGPSGQAALFVLERFLHSVTREKEASSPRGNA